MAMTLEQIKARMAELAAQQEAARERQHEAAKGDEQLRLAEYHHALPAVVHALQEAGLLEERHNPPRDKPEAEGARPLAELDVNLFFDPQDSNASNRKPLRPHWRPWATAEHKGHYEELVAPFLAKLLS